MIFDGRRFATFAQVEPRLRDRTVTMNGCSKAYAMTGWRIGFGGAAAPHHQGDGQAAGAKHLQHLFHRTGRRGGGSGWAEDATEAMRQVYEARRDRVVAALNETPHLRCHLPEGAFYAFPDMTACLGQPRRLALVRGDVVDDALPAGQDASLDDDTTALDDV